MKAIQVTEHGGPEVLKITELPDPKAGSDEVVVDIKAAGVNPVDTYLRAGQQGYAPKLPWTPGLDGAGVVAAVGSNVVHVKPGDRVYLTRPNSGSYAEKALCAGGQVHPLPDDVSFQQGAALYVNYYTAYQALFHRGMAQPGETLLVHGASGGVGVATLQWARAAGLIVVGTASTEKGRDLVLSQGAHYVLDHSKDGYLDELEEITGGEGPDIILEMLANVNLQKDLEVLSQHGRVVIIGCRDSVEINPRLAMGKDLDVMGMILFNATPIEMRAIRAAVLAGLEAGTLRPVIGREFPLAEAPAAHEAQMEPGAYGKIVLIP